MVVDHKRKFIPIISNLKYLEVGIFAYPNTHQDKKFAAATKAVLSVSSPTIIRQQFGTPPPGAHKRERSVVRHYLRTGEISFAKDGSVNINLSSEELTEILKEEL